MTEDLFPIMHSEIAAIPLALIAPHEAQTWRNHGQTLKRLAERGGLSDCEACAVLEDRRWRRMDAAEAKRRLNELVALFRGAENG